MLKGSTYRSYSPRMILSQGMSRAYSHLTIQKYEGELEQIKHLDSGFLHKCFSSNSNSNKDMANRFASSNS